MAILIQYYIYQNMHIHFRHSYGSVYVLYCVYWPVSNLTLVIIENTCVIS